MPSRSLRAFSVRELDWLEPRPMAQAITFRAFSAAKPLGYFQSFANADSEDATFCGKADLYITCLARPDSRGGCPCAFEALNAQRPPAGGLCLPTKPFLRRNSREKLSQRVAAAETSIYNRLQAISQSVDHRAEHQAIEDALGALRVLKRDSLGFPDWEKK